MTLLAQELGKRKETRPSETQRIVGSKILREKRKNVNYKQANFSIWRSYQTN